VTSYCCAKGPTPYCAVSRRSCVYRRQCGSTLCFRYLPHCCQALGRDFCTKTREVCPVRSSDDAVTTSQPAAGSPQTDIFVNSKPLSYPIQASLTGPTPPVDYTSKSTARSPFSPPTNAPTSASVNCGDAVCTAERPFCCGQSFNAYCTKSEAECEPYFCGNAPCPASQPKCCRTPTSAFCTSRLRVCPTLCGVKRCDIIRPFCCEAGPTKYCAVSSRSCVYKEPCGNTVCFRSRPHCCSEGETPFCVDKASSCAVAGTTPASTALLNSTAAAASRALLNSTAVTSAGTYFSLAMLSSLSHIENSTQFSASRETPRMENHTAPFLIADHLTFTNPVEKNSSTAEPSVHFRNIRKDSSASTSTEKYFSLPISFSKPYVQSSTMFSESQKPVETANLRTLFVTRPDFPTARNNNGSSKTPIVPSAVIHKVEKTQPSSFYPTGTTPKQAKTYSPKIMFGTSPTESKQFTFSTITRKSTVVDYTSLAATSSTTFDLTSKSSKPIRVSRVSTATQSVKLKEATQPAVAKSNDKATTHVDDAVGNQPNTTDADVFPAPMVSTRYKTQFVRTFWEIVYFVNNKQALI